MRHRIGTLLTGIAIGVAGTLIAREAAPPPTPLRPVTVTLHRFDVRDDGAPALREWIAYLRRHHRAAVATLDREHMYLEAKFLLPDDPARLYWLTVEGAGGAAVETATSDLDRRHLAYMKRALVEGSHRRAETQDVLMPDFLVAAIRRQQARER